MDGSEHIEENQIIYRWPSTEERQLKTKSFSEISGGGESTRGEGTYYR